MSNVEADASLTLTGTGTSMGVPMIGCSCAVCTSLDPRNQRLRTGVVVANGARKFLIDTSPELRLQLVRARVASIEGVIFTHAHADHILGLDDLRIFCFRQQQMIPLYCEPDVEQTLRNTFAYAFVERPQESLHSLPALCFETIDPEAPFEVCGLSIQPIRFIHGKLPILGFRIRDVAFCTDVRWIPEESWEKLEGLETLVIGAIGHDPHPTHLNISGALEVVERVRPQRTFITHVSHRLDYARTNAELPANVELAYDGLTIPL